MTLDQAIQNMLFNSTDSDLESLEWLARKERDDTIEDYRHTWGWTHEECEEFLDNATLAYDLLVRSKAA